MNKLKIVLLVVFGIIFICIFIVFIQNIIAQNEIKELSKDDYISILKDDGVRYHDVPPISRSDLLNIKNRNLYKIIYFNGSNTRFVLVKKISQKKIEELLKMIEESQDNYKVKESKYISPADISGYYYLNYNDKNVKLEQLPFSY